MAMQPMHLNYSLIPLDSQSHCILSIPPIRYNNNLAEACAERGEDLQNNQIKWPVVSKSRPVQAFVSGSGYYGYSATLKSRNDCPMASHDEMETDVEKYSKSSAKLNGRQADYVFENEEAMDEKYLVEQFTGRKRSNNGETYGDLKRMRSEDMQCEFAVEKIIVTQPVDSYPRCLRGHFI